MIKEPILRDTNGRFKKGGRGGWNGGKTITKGYIYVYSPNHPNKVKGTYILEHRLVMEKHIGRYLLKKEVVHHIDGIKTNNHIENLRLFKNDSKHSDYHNELKYPKNFIAVEKLFSQIIAIKKNYTWNNLAIKLKVPERVLRSWVKKEHQLSLTRYTLLKQAFEVLTIMKAAQ